MICLSIKMFKDKVLAKVYKWVPAVDAECEVTCGALAHVLLPVYHGGALTGQAGAEHHVHHGLQLGLQQDPLIALIQLLGDELRHLEIKL